MSTVQFLHILSMKKTTVKPPKRNLICLNIRKGFTKQDESLKLMLFLSFPYYCGKTAGKYHVKRSFNFLEDACLKILISLHLMDLLI